MTTYTRRQLSKLTASVLDTNENRRVTNQYLDAIRSIDIPTIEFFQSMGKNPRQQIINVNEHQHALRFGFNKLQFCKYGWFDYQWSHEESIDFTTKDQISTNKISLASSPNDKWAYGVSLSFGNYGGMGYAPSVFGKLFNTREECLQAAIAEAVERFEHEINSPCTKPTKCLEKMKNVLEQLITFKHKSTHVQLDLFNT